MKLIKKAVNEGKTTEEVMKILEGGSNPLDIVPELYRNQVESAFEEGTITKVTNTDDVYVYRHWGDGSAESGSPWYSTQRYSPKEAKAKLALPECNSAQDS